MSIYDAEGSGFKSWCTLANSGLRGHEGPHQNRLEKLRQRRKGSCHTVALASPLATLVFPQYYPTLLSRYLKLHTLLHHVNTSAHALEQWPWVSAVLFCRTIPLGHLIHLLVLKRVQGSIILSVWFRRLTWPPMAQQIHLSCWLPSFGNTTHLPPQLQSSENNNTPHTA